MYEGVDTVILNNELAYEDLLSVAFKPLSRPLGEAAAGALADRNVRLLQVCAPIEEQGAVERKDDASPHSAETGLSTCRATCQRRATRSSSAARRTPVPSMG